MAYFTDYNTTVSYNTSVTITMSAVSNAVADLLVSYAGFTLVSHATEGVASSTSNYAEVSWQTLHLRIYGTSTTSYSIRCINYYDGATSATGNGDVTLPSVAGTYVSIGMRVVPYKRGKAVFLLNSSAAYNSIYIQLIARSIASGTDYYAAINITSSGVSAMPVADGLSLVYYHHPGINIYDSTATSQVLVQGSVMVTSSASNYSRKYLLQDVYTSGAMIMTGFVLIGSKYFFIDGYYAFEINP